MTSEVFSTVWLSDVHLGSRASKIGLLLDFVRFGNVEVQRSLARHVKARIGNAVRYVDKFQRASLRAAADGGFDGVVCGHIHQADLIERDGLVYCNDGDWVESCTAIVEQLDGDLRLVSWRRAVASDAAAVPLRDAA